MYLRRNSMYDLLFKRMFGLIISILIFTNIIFYIKYFLGLYIWILVYVCLLIIGILNEFFNIIGIWYLKPICINNTSTVNLLNFRLMYNSISIMLNDKNRELNSYNINSNNLEKLKIRSLWNSINNINDYIDKPSFSLYLDI